MISIPNLNYDAEREYRKAIELNPRYQESYELLSYLLVATGRFEQGIEMAKRGLDVDPLSVVLSDDLGLAYYLARRYDEAIRQYQNSAEIDSTQSQPLHRTWPGLRTKRLVRRSNQRLSESN